MFERVILSKVQLAQHLSAALNAIMQCRRWLFTLKSLHELKGEWAEAAEASILCAKTVAESILHNKKMYVGQQDLYYEMIINRKRLRVLVLVTALVKLNQTG